MQIHPLTTNERTRLADYRVWFGPLEESPLSLTAAQLLDPLTLKPFLSQLQDRLGAPDLRTAASIFSKRYGYLMTVPVFYSFSVWNKALQLQQEQMGLAPSDSEEHWLPRLGLPDTVLQPESAEERSELRDTLIQSVFANHLEPLWQVLSETASISKQVLWENTAVYLFWLYEVHMEADFPQEVRARASEDFKYVLYQADRSLFGSGQQHPFAKFHTEKQPIGEKMIRIRQTCCLTYMASGSYCSTCPKAPSVIQS